MAGRKETPARLQDLGLSRNLLPTPLGGAAGSSPGTHPAPNFRTARKLVLEGSQVDTAVPRERLGKREGGLPAVLPWEWLQDRMR
jgi:hypothetical protein